MAHGTSCTSRTSHSGTLRSTWWRTGIALAFAATLAIHGAAAQTTTGTVSTGQTLYNTHCDLCHGATPGLTHYQAIRNAANAGGVINRAMMNGMGGFNTGSFTATQENHLAAFIATTAPQPNPANLAIPHDSPGVTFTLPNIRLNSTYGDFQSIVLVTAPLRGTVTFNGADATYVPAPGAFGSDSFTWQATGGPGDTAFRSNVRTVTLAIAPLPPVITSPRSVQARVGVPSTYFIQAGGGAATGYAAVPLPPGMVLMGNQISGTPLVAYEPPLAAPFVTRVTAANSGGSDAIDLEWTIERGAQVITFPAQTFYTWPLAGFGIVPPAVSNAGLPITYSSATPAVCSVNGTAAMAHSAGICTVAANQPGNPNWLPAAEVRRDIEIRQAQQFISFGAQVPSSRPYVHGGSFPLNPAGSVASGLAVAHASVTPAVCTVSGVTVSIVAAGTCTIAASQAGDINHQAASTVLRSVAITPQLPKAPAVTAAGPADGAAIVAFTANPDTGGVPLIDHTAVCSRAGLPDRTATAAASPITVTGLTNGLAYACLARSRNAVGTGAGSPAQGVVPGVPAFTGSVIARRVNEGMSHDIDVDAMAMPDAALTIDPRVAGTPRLLFQFSAAVALPGTAVVLDRQGGVLGNAAVTALGTQVEVTLGTLGQPLEGARVQVVLAGVNGGAGASAWIGFLAGDASGNGSVGAADIAGVKARAGLDARMPANARFDINADGVIDARDVTAVKSRAGRLLP